MSCLGSTKEDSDIERAETIQTFIIKLSFEQHYQQYDGNNDSNCCDHRDRYGRCNERIRLNVVALIYKSKHT